MLFFFNFFSRENIILCILKGNTPFKMHKIIFFLKKNPEKILGFTSNFRQGRVTLNIGILLIGLLKRNFSLV